MDMVEFVQGLNVVFSDDDKEASLPVVDKMTKLAELARKEGVLSFDEAAEAEDNAFLKTALTLVADNTGREETRDMLQLMILAEKYDKAELFYRLVMAVGILDIQAGDNPRIIRNKMLNLLGEKHAARVREVERGEMERNRRLKAFVQNAEAQMTCAELSEFEALISKMSSNTLSRVLSEIPDETLAKALRGIQNFRVMRRIFHYNGNLSNDRKDRWITLFEDYAQLPPHAVEAAFGEISKIVKNLEDEGEIILSSDIV